MPNAMVIKNENEASRRTLQKAQRVKCNAVGRLIPDFMFPLKHFSQGAGVSDRHECKKV
jgi:hypothetical protein